MQQEAAESDAVLVDDVERGLAREAYEEGYRAWKGYMSGFDWCMDTGRFGSLGESGISDIRLCSIGPGRLSPGRYRRAQNVVGPAAARAAV